jgi:hypothetical protein
MQNTDKWILYGLVIAALLLSMRAFYLSGNLYNKFVEPMANKMAYFDSVLSNHKDVIQAIVVQNTKVLDSIRAEIMRGEQKNVKETPPVSKGVQRGGD